MTTPSPNGLVLHGFVASGNREPIANGPAATAPVLSRIRTREPREPLISWTKWLAPTAPVVSGENTPVKPWPSLTSFLVRFTAARPSGPGAGDPAPGCGSSAGASACPPRPRIVGRTVIGSPGFHSGTIGSCVTSSTAAARPSIRAGLIVTPVGVSSAPRTDGASATKLRRERLGRATGLVRELSCRFLPHRGPREYQVWSAMKQTGKVTSRSSRAPRRASCSSAPGEAGVFQPVEVRPG